MYHILKFENIFEDEAIKILIDFKYSIIHPIWKKHPTSEEFRHSFNITLNLSDTWNIRCFLTDATQINYVEISDQNWLIDQINSRINNSKIILFARVISHESTSLYENYNIINRVNKEYNLEGGMASEVFSDLDSATFWLLSNMEES